MRRWTSILLLCLMVGGLLVPEASACCGSRLLSRAVRVTIRTAALPLRVVRRTAAHRRNALARWAHASPQTVSVAPPPDCLCHPCTCDPCTCVAGSACASGQCHAP